MKVLQITLGKDKSKFKISYLLERIKLTLYKMPIIIGTRKQLNKLMKELKGEK